MGSICARCSGFGFLLVTIAAAAQNTFPATGNVGIGTTAPGTPLQVVGTGNVVSIGEAANSSGHQLLFGVNNSGNGYSTIQSLYQGTAYTPLILDPNGGNVGIGTTSPRSGLEVADLDGYYPSTTTMSLRVGGINGGPNSVSLNGVSTTYQILFSSYRDIQADTVGAKIAAINNAVYSSGGAGNYFRVQNTDLAFSTLSTAPASVDATTEKMRLTAAGNLGIGTISPGAKLEVSGNVKLTSGSGASITYQDGSVQNTAWNGVLSGGDYAESVDVGGERDSYEPGDVLVIDTTRPGKFVKSVAPYSTTVAGIYSTKPGVRGRRQATDTSRIKEEVPMAMIGIVPAKVTVEGGPISIGDLLVTSSTPGYAMRGGDRARLPGAIVGKAIGALNSGTGIIEVLVSLQ